MGEEGGCEEAKAGKGDFVMAHADWLGKGWASPAPGERKAKYDHCGKGTETCQALVIPRDRPDVRYELPQTVRSSHIR